MSVQFPRITTEDTAEAEHDLWRKINSAGSLLRNQLQCSVHSSTGEINRRIQTHAIEYDWNTVQIYCFWANGSAPVCRVWRSWTHRLQRRRWLRPTRNISLTWLSSSKSRRNPRCEYGTLTHCRVFFPWHCVYSCVFTFLIFVLIKCDHFVIFFL